jgi:UV DNA damage repair endonuclease
MKNIKRIGFACKWIDHEGQVDGIKPKDDAKQYNTRSTTVRWLNNQTKEVAEQRLWDLMVHNIESSRKLVERIGALDEHLRMVRLSSDILPVYTQHEWCYFWRRSDVVAYAERAFGEVGELARNRGVRLSFHPGQFTVLASAHPGIVDRSIEEFEYHNDMIRWMGYGKTFQDFKCNVHISGKQGPEGIIKALPRLSPEARNTLTIENDEISWGLDASLELVDHCALVLDIHHHFIKTGEYINVDDDRFSRVLDSWRGVRPTIHYSVSREDVLPEHDSDTRPDLDILLESGYKKSKLRAHSNFYWNKPVTDWALTFLSKSDIMCESKAKNLASFQVADRAKELNLI